MAVFASLRQGFFGARHVEDPSEDPYQVAPGDQVAYRRLVFDAEAGACFPQLL